MLLKIKIILLLFIPLNSFSQSFYWEIDTNCFIISLEDLNRITNNQWLQDNDYNELNIDEFKDSLLAVNSIENPYISAPLDYIWLSNKDLLTYFIETKCRPEIFNKQSNKEEFVKKKVKIIQSPIGCSIYLLEFRTKKQRKVILNKKVIIGISS